LTHLSVLHVSQPTDGGVGVVAGRLVRDQVGRGWSVTVACPLDANLAAGARRDGADVMEWAAVREPGVRLGDEMRSLTRVIREVHPDVVHLHSSKAGLAGRLALRRRLPTVFQPHGWSFLAVGSKAKPVVAGWERWGARWTDAVVCVSDGERHLGAQQGVRANFVVIPNGVMVEAFGEQAVGSRAGARALLGLPPGPLAVCVGRLHEAKGQDLLLRAWADVESAVPEANLVLVGDGPDRAALEVVARPSVRFAGSTESVAQYMVAADVVVVPSRWEAGASLATVEAMASGRSVVANDVAGMGEALLPEAGAVVAVGDLRALADAVVTRLRTPGLADREGARGRVRAESDFRLADRCQMFADLYQDVLSRRGRC
jgi:glycosyltransferase involved in cell wall biosynthesis